MHAHAQPAPPDEMMGRMDDDALWQALRAADEQAFRMLFQRHSRAVYNLAFRHASSWATAEEATQACFSGIWRRAAAGTLPNLTGVGQEYEPPEHPELRLDGTDVLRVSAERLARLVLGED